MITSWHSYPKVWNLGHSAVKEIFFDEVHIEEKVDGSQFSFGVFDGVVKCRSKGQEIILGSLGTNDMFLNAVMAVLFLQERGLLRDGWTYRAEYLQKPKHNVLAYDRAPKSCLILFDVNTAQEEYLDYDAKKAEADRLGLECVPCLYRGKVDFIEQIKALLDTDSILGGQKIEGFVVKNYSRFAPDGKALLGKFVSERFKEIHKGTWRQDNPNPADIIDQLICSFKTPARWDKAIQHLKERGELESSPKDIGKLILEVKADTQIECAEEIKERLMAWAWPKIARALGSGLPEYYKQRLLETQFETESP